jgi:dolichyl-phosphate beta-glucosyltransferase
MISAVIPVYNEARRLTSSVEAMVAELRTVAGDDWELVLVDDGSQDDSPELVDRLAAADPHVRALHHEFNRGKGAAVRTGVLATRGDAVLFCDADLSTPPETLRTFLAALEEGADVVVGNRKSERAVIERWQPPIRTWLGLGFTRLANAMTGLSVLDYTCGFKLFRGEPARAVFQAVQTERWSFDVEVLARAARAGLQLKQIPIRWKHVDGTNVRVLRDVLGSFRELLAIRRRLGRSPPDAS